MLRGKSPTGTFALACVGAACFAVLSCASPQAGSGNAGHAGPNPADSASPTGLPSVLGFLDGLPRMEVLAKPKVEPQVRWAPKEPIFQHVLAVDNGIRSDDGGLGFFLAPRSHGQHNGIDYLAPLGTAVLAACSGQAKAATRGGYGRTVQLVCRLPHGLGGEDGNYVSFFYAHLDKVLARDGQFTPVSAGTKLGTVGKTGNAKGPKVRPHLHLEAIIRESERAALDERHSGLSAKAKQATDDLLERIESECLEPAKFASKHGIRRERRVDPFVLLTCAGKPKPSLTEPSDAGLKEAFVKWSEHYSAAGFEIDTGPR